MLFSRDVSASTKKTIFISASYSADCAAKFVTNGPNEIEDSCRGALHTPSKIGRMQCALTQTGRCMASPLRKPDDAWHRPYASRSSKSCLVEPSVRLRVGNILSVRP